MSKPHTYKTLIWQFEELSRIGYTCLLACTCDAILYSSIWDGGMGITRLSGIIPSLQVHRLHRITQLFDDTVRWVIEPEGIEKEFEKLWLAAGDDKEKIPFGTPEQSW